MSDRQNISSNSPYEPVYGYSRAVKVGSLVFVSGSGAWGDDAELVGVDDVYAQARQTIRNIEKASPTGARGGRSSDADVSRICALR